MPKQCKYAYYERNQASLRCLLIDNKQCNYCGYQYFCPTKQKWVNTDRCAECIVPETHKQN